MAKRKLLAIDYHRNGVCGVGFYVVTFRDGDGSRKVATWFGTTETDEAAACPILQDCYSVLDIDKLAAGSIATSDGALSNAWRGDHYADDIAGWVRSYWRQDGETRRRWNIGHTKGAAA